MFTRRIIELLAPTACLSCGAEGRLLCADCAVSAVAYKHGVCFACNRLSDDGRTCADCRRHTDLSGAVVGCYYDGVVKDLIWKLKFSRSRSAAEVGAALIVAQLPESLRQFDAVTAVPVAPSRYRERGYNQSELIAREVAKSLRLPYRRTLGRWTSQHQLGASRQDRLEQIHGAIFPIGRFSGERVLVVDDVMTTGATLAECASILRQAGAGQVWGAAIARH